MRLKSTTISKIKVKNNETTFFFILISLKFGDIKIEEESS